METLNCMIVDDEPLALNLLEEYVNRTPFLSLKSKCRSGVEAMAIHNCHIDVAFLDIQMPMVNGLELSKMLSDCAIIFTTAFEQYAIEGFKVNAIDYLLKPFSYTEFLSAANKALKYSELLRAAKKNKKEDHFSIIVKSDYRQLVIPINTIKYIEGIRDYIRIHTDDDEEPVQTLMTLKSIEDMLPKNKFIRVHRSFIVNLNKIKTIERGNIIFGKLYIPISDSYKNEFQKAFNSRLINQ